MSRYQHSFPPIPKKRRKKQNYSKLITEREQEQLERKIYLGKRGYQLSFDF
jgi:hypothetical protein